MNAYGSFSNVSLEKKQKQLSSGGIEAKEMDINSDIQFDKSLGRGKAAGTHANGLSSSSYSLTAALRRENQLRTPVLRNRSKQRDLSNKNSCQQQAQVGTCSLTQIQTTNGRNNTINKSSLTHKQQIVSGIPKTPVNLRNHLDNSENKSSQQILTIPRSDICLNTVIKMRKQSLEKRKPSQGK